MKSFLFFSLTLFSFILDSQTLHTVTPSQTSPVPLSPNNNHFAYYNAALTQKNKLVLFFPGTGAVPFNYTEFLKTAANLGYHSIGLTYPNPVQINQLCGTSTDTTCHGLARYEVFDGVDRSSLLAIDSNNCIQNRTIKLLQYLAAQYPSENWAQYFTGNTILWNKIIVAGHSQGGGHAGFISKIKLVDRVVMFAAMDWIPLLNRNADWITWSGPTASSNYFGFIHMDDELVDFTNVQTTWQNYGMAPFGPLTFVDNTVSPYGNTHRLYTNLTPANDTSKYHACVVSDAYTPTLINGSFAFKPVWEYMMDAPISASINTVETITKPSVGPNPFKDYIQINSLNVSACKWVLYNMLGMPVMQGSETKNIVTESLVNGIYILKLTQNSHTYLFKLSKR
jgi:hypothetical protein